MNQPYARVNQPYATLTLASALREMFGVQLYKNNARALLSRILSILNLDWLQHARSVRGVYEYLLLHTWNFRQNMEIWTPMLYTTWHKHKTSVKQCINDPIKSRMPVKPGAFAYVAGAVVSHNALDCLSEIYFHQYKYHFEMLVVVPVGTVICEFYFSQICFERNLGTNAEYSSYSLVSLQDCPKHNHYPNPKVCKQDLSQV